MKITHHSPYKTILTIAGIQILFSYTPNGIPLFFLSMITGEDPDVWICFWNSDIRISKKGKT